MKNFIPLPCPFCGEIHTVIQMADFLGWDDPVDGVAAPIHGDYYPVVVVECVDDLTRIPLTTWSSRANPE